MQRFTVVCGGGAATLFKDTISLVDLKLGSGPSKGVTRRIWCNKWSIACESVLFCLILSFNSSLWASNRHFLNRSYNYLWSTLFSYSRTSSRILKLRNWLPMYWFGNRSYVLFCFCPCYNPDGSTRTSWSCLIAVSLVILIASPSCGLSWWDSASCHWGLPDKFIADNLTTKRKVVSKRAEVLDRAVNSSMHWSGLCTR